MNDDDPIINIDTTAINPTTYTLDDLTVTIPPTQDIGNITLTMPEPPFTINPDFESHKIKKELGIDVLQEVKRSFGEE